MGDGPRGLQRQRDAWGLPTTRRGRAPTAGARTAWPASATTAGLCLALALWNGRDPILKERLFGLTNAEGNHGEDVKEYYFYLDDLPTHSYKDSSTSTRRPSSRTTTWWRRTGPGHGMTEFELLDTGVFEDGATSTSSRVRQGRPGGHPVPVTAHNSGPGRRVHLLPTLWYRNTWSWGGWPKPRIARLASGTRSPGPSTTNSASTTCTPSPQAGLLFSENETNTARIVRHRAGRPASPKTASANVLHGADTVNPATREPGRRAYGCGAGRRPGHDARAAHPAGPGAAHSRPSRRRRALARRRAEADDFYAAIIRPRRPMTRRVMRQALAGMLWSKQCYHYDVDRWLRERHAPPAAVADLAGQPQRVVVPHVQPRHPVDARQVGVPLVCRLGPGLPLHRLPWSTPTSPRADDCCCPGSTCTPTASCRPTSGFRRRQPAGARVATLFLQNLERPARTTSIPRGGLPPAAAELHLVGEPQGSRGRNAFEGGFLGLDNIGVFDRSAALPDGGRLEQADGTAWMAMFCQNMLDVAGPARARRPVTSSSRSSSSSTSSGSPPRWT